MKTRINKKNQTATITVNANELSLIQVAMWDAYRKTEKQNLNYVSKDYYEFWGQLLDTALKLYED